MDWNTVFSAITDSSFWEFLTTITPVAGGALIGLGTALFLSRRANKRADHIYERDKDREKATRWSPHILSSAIEFRTTIHELVGLYEQIYLEKEDQDQDLVQIGKLRDEALEKILRAISIRNDLGFVASRATYDAANFLISHVSHVGATNRPYDKVLEAERGRLVGAFTLSVRKDIDAPEFMIEKVQHD